VSATKTVFFQYFTQNILILGAGADGAAGAVFRDTAHESRSQARSASSPLRFSPTFVYDSFC